MCRHKNARSNILTQVNTLSHSKIFTLTHTHTHACTHLHTHILIDIYFNLSFKLGIVSLKLKIAKIILVYKSGDKSLPIYYKPIP